MNEISTPALTQRFVYEDVEGQREGVGERSEGFPELIRIGTVSESKAPHYNEIGDGDWGGANVRDET